MRTGFDCETNIINCRDPYSTLNRSDSGGLVQYFSDPVIIWALSRLDFHISYVSSLFQVTMDVIFVWSVSDRSVCLATNPPASVCAAPFRSSSFLASYIKFGFAQ